MARHALIAALNRITRRACATHRWDIVCESKCVIVVCDELVLLTGVM
jgi:hypothetical protein